MTKAMRKLYDLVGTEDRRMSPFCWRAKLALAHKGLDFKSIPIKFSEKDKLAFSGQEQVPVLVDGDNTVFDSWTIACYLEKNYADSPALFSNSSNQTLTRIFNHWFDELVTLKLFPLMVPDNFDVVPEDDLEYYAESRYAWLGKSREELTAERSEEDFISWRMTMEPLREQLRTQKYLGGEEPLFADYIVFSMFMWARAVSPWPIILPADVLYSWRERMLDLHNGLARNSVGYAY
jgi:glutathione S-transferase